MKQFGLIVTLFLIASVVFAAEAEVRVDAASAYIWRGIVLNDEPVLQPAFTASASNGLSFSAWGNVNLTDGQDTTDRELNREFNEVDLIVAYTLPFTFVEAELGVIEYLYPNTDSAGTREAYATVSAALPLNPRATVYYDFDAVDGWYGVLSVTDSRDLTDSLTLDVVLSVGFADATYNNYYFEVDGSKLNDGSALVTLTQQIIDGVFVSLYGGYTRMLSDDIQDAAEALYDNESDNLYGGASVSYAF